MLIDVEWIVSFVCGNDRQSLSTASWNWDTTKVLLKATARGQIEVNSIDHEIYKNWVPETLQCSSSICFASHAPS